MKLSSIELIDKITPHNNADSLEIAHVGGYTSIVKKGEFVPNDAVVFIQPDTVLPDNKPWAEIFKKRSSRVKACKIRGEWSFGIVMHPYTVIEDTNELMNCLNSVNIGKDISDIIGVTKYEAPIIQHLDAAGPLPMGLSKTDEDRWQNLVAVLPYNELVDVSLKIDGQSATYYCMKNSQTNEWETGICSRSLRMKPEVTNNYTNIEVKYNILEKLQKYCIEHNVSLALRGEIYGGGVQRHSANPHAKLPLSFAAFSVFNMDSHGYENPNNTHYYEKVCIDIDIPTVPMIERQVVFTLDLITKYSLTLNHINGQRFEGVVIKHNNGSFKAINLSYDELK